MSGSGRGGSWAVDGAQGVGRPLAARLLADGDAVLNVPAKLATRVRVFGIGQGRKTDATDAHAVVMVALRTRGLRHASCQQDWCGMGIASTQRCTSRSGDLSGTATLKGPPPASSSVLQP